MSAHPSLNITPEERALLLCARRTLTPEQGRELTALVAGPLRWEQVWFIARWHELTPLACHHLSRLENQNRIPAPLLEEFRNTYRSSAVLNLYMHSQLRLALECLQSRHIPVIALKGAAIAGPVYGDIGLRPMSDLDLLVPDDLAHQAQKLVQEELGYHEKGSAAEQAETERDHRHLPGLVMEGKPVLIEIHRHVVRRDSGLYFDIAGFWQRAQETPVAGTRALTLAPEDLLIHLSLNFFLDRRFRSLMALRQLCDIAECLRRYGDEIDCELLVRSVKEYRLTGSLGSVLYTAQELLEAPVPPAAAQQLWPQGFKPQQVERFWRRRVLDTQTWVARSLAQPGAPYRTSRVALAALRRLIPSRRYLARQQSQAAEQGPRSFLPYLGRIGHGFSYLLRGIGHPGQLREDLAIDRWHHSLYPYHGEKTGD